MDTASLKKGHAYSKLRKSYVIFICKYDYNKDEFPLYSYRTTCEQNGKKPDDGAYDIILNTEFEYLKNDNIV